MFRISVQCGKLDFSPFYLLFSPDGAVSQIWVWKWHKNFPLLNWFSSLCSLLSGSIRKSNVGLAVGQYPYIHLRNRLYLIYFKIRMSKSNYLRSDRYFMIQPLNSLKNWSNADWSNALVIFLVLNTQAILYLKSEYSKQILLYLVYIFCTFAAGYPCSLSIFPSGYSLCRHYATTRSSLIGFDCPHCLIWHKIINLVHESNSKADYVTSRI